MEGSHERCIQVWEDFTLEVALRVSFEGQVRIHCLENGEKNDRASSVNKDTEVYG